MKYAIATIWFHRGRYLVAILTVAISTVLIALQMGILIGLVSMISFPVDISPADIWVGAPHTRSCDLGLFISTETVNRLRMRPEVQTTDLCVHSYAFWKNPQEGEILVIVLGCTLGERSLGPISHLTPQQRVLLSEEGAVIVDRTDCKRLGIERIGQTGEVMGHRVRVVGFGRNMASISGPYVICSLETARRLARYRPDQATYLLARCREAGHVPSVLASLASVPSVQAFSRREFSLRSRMYWLRTTRSGVAVGFLAGLGLAIGALVTSHTLYSAVLASIKELALLRALGAPRWRMAGLVLQQSFVVGLLGIALGVPATLALVHVARAAGTRAVLPAWLVCATAAVTLSMSMLSGLLALRSLRHSEPATLLR